ncbi:MAG: type III secretion system stator protein SctL [Burkholderiaceae bacterium]
MGLAFLISTDNLQLLSERKVFKEAEYAALLDAAAVLDAARAEAARLSAQAAQDAAVALESGRAEGLRRAQAEYAQRLAADALATQRQLQALRTSMAQIVVRAVGQFMGEVDPARLLEAALRRVDALLRAEPFVALRVAPAQEAAVRQALAALGQEAGWALGAAVAADPALAEGACVVSTASGTLEIGVDAQLEAFRRAVESGGGLS